MQSNPNNQHANTAQDTWESVVSEWVDGESEIRPEDLDTPYGRQVWDNYHLIGDALRSQDLAFKPSDMFYARVSRAIDEEPPIKAVKPLEGIRWAAGLSGLAVAAAAFGAVWLSIPYFVGSYSGSEPVVTEMVAAEPLEDPSLYEYFDAHIAMAGGVSP